MAERCGAKTRSGGGCRTYAMPNGRCRLHGGLSTGPGPGNTNALKHGFYSNAITADEKELYERAPIGGLDDEIKLMRVKLHRLVKLSGSSDVADLIDSAMTIAQKHDVHPELGPFERREIKVKAAQYADLICQALDQLRKLELARKELLQTDGKPPPNPQPFTRLVVEVINGSAKAAEAASGS